MTAISQPVVKSAPHRPDFLQRLFQREAYVLILLLVVVVGVMFILVPESRQPRVFFDLLREVAPNLIAVIGISLLMIGGEFDLTVGSMLAAVGVVTVAMFNLTQSMGLGIVVGLLTGPLVGCIVGYFVTRLKMTSLMTTLGMMFALRGAVYVYTNKTPVVDKNQFEAFIWLYQGSIGPVAVPTILAVLLIIAFLVVSTQTEFGRHIYAVGGNAHAARVSGIKVEWVKFALFVLSGTMSAVAGMLVAAQTGTGYFDAGLGFELLVITATVLGGVSLAGGEGSLLGAVLGVLILGMTGKGLRLMAMPTTTQLVVTGLVMMLAVYLHGVRKRVLARK
jgi:ribose transport system permease protein